MMARWREDWFVCGDGRHGVKETNDGRFDVLVDGDCRCLLELEGCSACVKSLGDTDGLDDGVRTTSNEMHVESERE